MSTVSSCVSPMAEVVDFIVSQPSPEQMLSFRFSDEVQELASELLAKNRSGNLTDDERQVLEQLTQLGSLLSLLKAKVRLVVRNSNDE
jgi:hypothetical protein